MKLQMKAAVCRQFGAPLEIEDLVIDDPGPGEVRVKIQVCAICHSDISYMLGAWGGSLPAVYGHEAAGTVERIGLGVEGLRPGDPVVVTLLRSCGKCFYCARGEPHLCETEFNLSREHRLGTLTGETVLSGLGTGAFAEYAVVHASQVVPIGEDISPDSASLLACGVITGYGAVVNTARVPAGSSVVVVGAGGVGLNSVQGARMSGAHPVIAVDLLDSKLEAAIQFGASHGFNPRREDVQGRVQSLTKGRGADFVFVAAGSKPAIDQGLALLRRGGTFVMVGMPPYSTSIQVEAADFAGDGKVILGSRMGSTRLSVDVPKLVELYQDGQLKLDELITGRFGLEEINQAVESVRLGEALRNIIVF